jgi:hypothetical protein
MADLILYILLHLLTADAVQMLRPLKSYSTKPATTAQLLTL